MARRRRRSGIPGARGLIGTLRRWWRRWVAWLMVTIGEAQADDEPVRTTDVAELVAKVRTQQDQAPQLPERRIGQVAIPIAQRAGRREREVLRRAGMPPELADRRLGRIEQSPFGIDVLGIDLVPSIEARTLEAWAAEGVDFIRAVPRDLLEDLPAVITESVVRGETWKTLRGRLGERLDIGKRHLELIARDQAAKLNSRITEDMHRAAGVEEYTWRANKDERVRASHRAADGLVVRWDSPGVPGTGFYNEPAHAGRAGQCRCTPEPVVPAEWLG